MVWPPLVQCKATSTIFEDTPKVFDYKNYQYRGICGKEKSNLRLAVRRVKEKAAKEKTDPASYTVVAVLGSGRLQVGWDVCHCLMSHHVAAQDTFFSLQHRRFLSLREVGRLQGVNVDRMTINMTHSQVGRMLGNGFTSTVVARVVAAAIQAAEGQVGTSARRCSRTPGSDTPVC